MTSSSPAYLASVVTKDQTVPNDPIDFVKLDDENKKLSQLLKDRDNELSRLTGTSDAAFMAVWQGHRRHWKNLIAHSQDTVQSIREYYRGIDLVLQNAIVTGQATEDCKQALKYYVKDQASLLSIMESWAATLVDGIQHSLRYKPISGGNPYDFPDASGTAKLFYDVFQNFSKQDKGIYLAINEMLKVTDSELFRKQTSTARQFIGDLEKLLEDYSTHIHTYDDDNNGTILPTI